MKKQITIAVSFCALLVVSKFAPNIAFDNNHNINRFPASESEDVDIKEEAQVTCLENKQPTAIEEEIKRLVADKEAILKEIEELKSSKVEIKNKNLAQSSDKEIVIALMSQMTSMMISQQEHQQILMQQMFTMINQMPMQSYPQQLQPPLNMPLSNQYSIFGSMNPGIGIGYFDQSAVSAKNPYEVLSSNSPVQPMQNFVQKDVQVQPQFYSDYPAGNMGFNFLTSNSSSEMQRMMF